MNSMSNFANNAISFAKKSALNTLLFSAVACSSSDKNELQPAPVKSKKTTFMMSVFSFNGLDARPDRPNSVPTMDKIGVFYKTDAQSADKGYSAAVSENGPDRVRFNIAAGQTAGFEEIKGTNDGYGADYKLKNILAVQFINTKNDTVEFSVQPVTVGKLFSNNKSNEILFAKLLSGQSLAVQMP